MKKWWHDKVAYQIYPKKLMLLANYQNEEQTIELLKPYSKVLLNNCDAVKHEDDKIILQGYQALIFEV